MQDLKNKSLLKLKIKQLEIKFVIYLNVNIVPLKKLYNIVMSEVVQVDFQ